MDWIIWFYIVSNGDNFISYSVVFHYMAVTVGSSGRRHERRGRVGARLAPPAVPRPAPPPQARQEEEEVAPLLPTVLRTPQSYSEVFLNSQVVSSYSREDKLKIIKKNVVLMLFLYIYLWSFILLEIYTIEQILRSILYSIFRATRGVLK